MAKERSHQRSTSSPPATERGGGAGAHPSGTAPSPPSPALPHRGGEGPSAPPGDDLVLVGEFGRAHGLKGEVRLKSHTGDPVAIASYGPLATADGRKVSLRKNVRQAPGGAPDMLIAQVEGITSREAAEALNRVRLYVARDALPPPDEEDEFLLADLVGLSVQDEAGTLVGTVADVPNYGGGDLLDIRSAATGATALLPFTKAFVPVVDLAHRRIVVALPDDFFAPARPAPESEDEA